VPIPLIVAAMTFIVRPNNHPVRVTAQSRRSTNSTLFFGPSKQTRTGARAYRLRCYRLIPTGAIWTTDLVDKTLLWWDRDAWYKNVPQLSAGSQRYTIVHDDIKIATARIRPTLTGGSNILLTKSVPCSSRFQVSFCRFILVSDVPQLADVSGTGNIVVV